jgi:hypothetical protein
MLAIGVPDAVHDIVMSSVGSIPVIANACR